MLIERKDGTGAVLIPRSDATNVYDLLMDVAACIRAEPKRYDQTTWIFYAHSRLRFGEEEIPANMPACGTVGCRAGWITLLAGYRPSVDGVAYTAKLILGIGRQYVIEGKFDFNEEFNVEVDKLFSAYSVDELPGSWIHADLGARGIEEFAERFKDRLLATPVVYNHQAP